MNTNQEERPTPRTDAHQNLDHMAHDHLWSDFARTLERELAEAREENARMKKDWDSDSAIFVGAIRLLVENKIDGGSTEILAAAERMRNIEEQRDDAMGQIEEMEIRHAAAMLHTQSIVDDANKVREQRDSLAAAMERIQSDASTIQYLTYGYDGDCGAVKIAERIEFECGQAIASVKGGQE